MPLFQALVLGLIQGLTEFVPVSSSGHLTLFPFFFGWSEPSIAFVVAVHIGTLVAVVIVFRELVLRMIRTLFSYKRAEEEDKKLLRYVVIATIPAVIIGVAFESTISSAFEHPVPVALLLGLTGYLLMSAESIVEVRESDPVEGQKLPRDIDDMSQGDAIAVGIAQAVAILPGVSRSGATISTGMRRGLTRKAATRFSFLMSIPIIFGAALAEVPKMLKEANKGAGAGAILIGIVVAGVSGFFAIRWFIGIIERRGLRPFGVYCFVLMVAGLVGALARG